jgi:ABC-type sugar transport system ATPase subunit
VMVMKDGQTTAELTAGKISEEDILTHSIGDKSI